METRDYIQMELDGLKRGMSRALKTLSQNELMWRPACGCNSIGLILFHTARSEDQFVQARLQGKAEVWSAEKWFTKLNMAESEVGGHYTVDQVNAFPVPEAKDLLAYYDVVRARTTEYLKTLSPEAFERKVTMPFGELTVAMTFNIVVTHTAQHVGEISYLRGLQRGMDK